ncbi:molecular chaperone HtpG, partial [Tremellales sp. Uapishka_1]
MSKEELAQNLGTIARSGTSEFLKKADESGGNDGNLIGQFGLGFYSCFLVSPTVRVSSLPPATLANPSPIQNTFVSTSSGDSFEIYPDPRGNTLGRGTEIVLTIQEDEGEWLSVTKLQALIDKHSQFATTFPIYIKERKISPSQAESSDDQEDEDDVEENEWVRVNDKAPIWMREPKDVSEEEYREFYKAVAKDPSAETLGWGHFKGDSGSGVSYKAIMYIPSKLPQDFWQKMTSGINNVRLMVKRVFITDDMGEEYMPRWLSFLKVTVDGGSFVQWRYFTLTEPSTALADDLPLNVSRETLQHHRFLKQLQRILVRKAIDLFTKLSVDEPEKYKEVSEMYGNALRIGMLESQKDKVKLAKLLRFESTMSNYTSLEEYVDNRKTGQTQIYYMAGVGEKAEDLARSPFVEKLFARGYEVLLLNLPSDEPMMGALTNFMGMTTQDVSKKGLKYGDEDEDEAEKKELAGQNVAFRPLIEWLKTDLKGLISDVVLTNRLVTSPCTIVVDSMGWSANMARLMAGQQGMESDPMMEMMKNLPKVLEINPKSPLIEGLLERVLELPLDEGQSDSYEAVELRETVRVLFDTTLVRSGFNVADPTSYFTRVEALLRRSLGVSLSAKAESKVKPAPPTAVGPLPEDDLGLNNVEFVNDDGEALGSDPAEWADWKDLKRKFEHDEL